MRSMLKPKSSAARVKASPRSGRSLVMCRVQSGRDFVGCLPSSPTEAAMAFSVLSSSASPCRTAVPPLAEVEDDPWIRTRREVIEILTDYQQRQAPGTPGPELVASPVLRHNLDLECRSISPRKGQNHHAMTFEVPSEPFQVDIVVLGDESPARSRCNPHTVQGTGTGKNRRSYRRTRRLRACTHCLTPRRTQQSGLNDQAASRAMISFWISVVPPKIDCTWLSRQSSQSWRRAVD